MNTKTRQYGSHRFVLILLTATAIFLGVFVFIVFLFLDSQIRPLREDYQKTRQFIKGQEKGFEYLFTTIFDDAKKCYTTGAVTPRDIYRCEKENERKIYRSIRDTGELVNFPSTYFIRLSNNGELEKLFLSGKYISEPIDNDGERKVVLVLTGKQTELIGTRINETFSDMRYLYDFYSEAEIIVPVKINNRLLGAVVRLYGD